MTKTVIQVWVTKCQKEFPPIQTNWLTDAGLGDLIRGSIGLHKICAAKGYELIVDISLHPVSQYLQQKPHRFSQLVQDKKNNITGVSYKHLQEYLELLLNKRDVVICHAISWPTTYNKPASAELKDFIKTILTPTPEFAAYYAEVQRSLPSSYHIFHVRVGDDELVDGKFADSYEKFIKLYEPSAESTLVLSDSQNLKQIMVAKFGLHALTHAIAHVGKQTDTIGIRNTLAEFFLTTQATSIQSLTIYWWTSGFIKTANYIYDVPLKSTTDVK